MALIAVQAAMTLENNPTVHPSFSKPSNNQVAEQLTDPEAAHIEDLNNDVDYENGEMCAYSEKGRKKRSRKGQDSKGREGRGKAKSQASLEMFTRKADDHVNHDKLVSSNAGPTSGPNIEEDPNKERRKRRKTASPGLEDGAVHKEQTMSDMSWHHQLQVEAAKDTDQAISLRAPAQKERQSTVGFSAENQEQLGIASIDISVPPSGNTTENTVRPTKNTTPKKTLKINRNGKLLSPTSSKPAPEPTASPKKRRGRKKAIERTLPTVTVIKYGSDTLNRREIGKKIETILNGAREKKARPTTSKKPSKPASPPKSTHPFFLGKPASKTEEISASHPVTAHSSLPLLKGPRKTAVTPGKLRSESCEQKPRPIPAFGPIAGDSRAPKYPGMKEPLWPAKGNAHIRNIDESELLGGFQLVPLNPLQKSKKFKGGVVNIHSNDDILQRLSAQLKPFIHKKNGSDNEDYRYFASMRVPERLLTTGVHIKECVRHEIPDLLSHPALISLFNKIEHTLTPFDKGQCEQQSWVSKYAPISASHVLQRGKEAYVLRDWLQNLTVQSVRSREEVSNSTHQSETKKPAKKKRKKNDDFIVSDFDLSEDEDMVELSDPEGHEESPHDYTQTRSVKRPRMSRDNNVILISGPHGCGKSATVYAVAKELGFEVFEINPGSRRSGKDIQDKVGNMSENHLVNHKRDSAAPVQEVVSADDVDNERMTKALQDDLKSGRQGTMKSFFTSKPHSSTKSKHQPKPSIEEKKTSRATPSAQPTLLTPKSQKQSLILLEEADVLFEEDQQFWAQVTKLASQSKRPIVITCHDESRIPIYDLPLGAILRLTPPPVNLATHYMLVLAGHEGHVLQRTAVRDLYHSKGCDLRASINELDFWCQMSVGDRKGGLEWMYQRWPPGQDVDEHGRILRVASQGTYQSGMGWLSHDLSTCTDNIGFSHEEELLKQAWSEWGLDPLTWDRLDTSSLANPTPLPGSPAQSLDVLKQLDGLLEAASAADIYCHVGLPSYQSQYDEPLDPTLPPIHESERANYTAEVPVIQDDQTVDYSMFDTDMTVQRCRSIQRTYGAAIPESRGSPRTEPVESDLTRAILLSKDKPPTLGSLTRLDFSQAFDYLAESANTTLPSSNLYCLVASSFDRTFRIIVEDLAPYVRAIVAHEIVQESQRLRLGNLLSEGGRGKRPRATRASRVAVEGGTRESKRRETWFNKDLNRVLVMGTAGREWTGLGAMAEDSGMASETGTVESMTST